MYSSGRRNDGILREGYLDKVKWSKVNKIVSSGKMKDYSLLWKRYFWVLRDSLLLEAYKSDSKVSKEVVKTINLHHCDNVSVCDMDVSLRHRYAFELEVHDGGTVKHIVFNADSERLRDKWVSDIVESCGLILDDGETYETLDNPMTPNDRRQIANTIQPSEDTPPLLPSHPPPKRPSGQQSFNTPPTRPVVGLAVQTQHQFGGSLEDVRMSPGGYGFLHTIARSQTTGNMAHQLLFDNDDDEEPENEDSDIFGLVDFPGQGGATNVIEKAEYRALYRKAPQIPPKLPTRHPADRPPMPLPTGVPIATKSPSSAKKTVPKHPHTESKSSTKPPTLTGNTQRDAITSSTALRPAKHHPPSNPPPTLPKKDHLTGFSSELSNALRKKNEGNPEGNLDTRTSQPIPKNRPKKSPIIPPQPPAKPKKQPAHLPPSSHQSPDTHRLGPPRDTHQQPNTHRPPQVLPRDKVPFKPSEEEESDEEPNEYYNDSPWNLVAEDHTRSPIGHTPSSGNATKRMSYDEVFSPTPPSPAPPFPNSPLSTYSTSSESSSVVSSEAATVISSKQSPKRHDTLDGKSLSRVKNCDRQGQPENTNSRSRSTEHGESHMVSKLASTREPIYVNWPLPDDIRAELSAKPLDGRPDDPTSATPPIPSRERRNLRNQPSSPSNQKDQTKHTLQNYSKPSVPNQKGDLDSVARVSADPKQGKNNFKNLVAKFDN